MVFRAQNTITGEVVALKRVKPNIGGRNDGFSINALREINVLLALKHPNIVGVKEMVVGSSMDNVFMVMEYFENDLKHVMEQKMVVFDKGAVKCLMEQLLKGVKHMHDHWYIHRDLKTSNILINKHCRLAIADFGLARKYGSPLGRYTFNVVTREYRCPELLLGQEKYSTAVDMWR